jgi:RNA polymerase sigma-70 factor (ECF subfamily)
LVVILRERSTWLERHVVVRDKSDTLTGTRTMWARGAIRVSDAEVDGTQVSDALDRTDAFKRVAESHLRDAYRLAGAILGDPTEARDAVHDAFITGWKRWPSLRDQAKFDSWFKRIIINECRDRLRRSSRRKTSDLDSHAGDLTTDVSQQIDARLLVEESLARLKPDDRIVLALRYFYDLRVDDIAMVLDIPPGTVKSRLNHAQSRLRAIVDRTQREGGSR